MVQWLAIAVSLLALCVSVAAYRAGIPRLKVVASAPAILLGDDELGVRSIIVVSVSNEGGRPAPVDSVYLSSGTISGRSIKGPTLPVALDGGGTQLRWIFDYENLRRQIGEQIRTEFRDPKEPLLIRATVHAGSRTLRSNPVAVNPPGVAAAHQTRRQRWRSMYQSWVHPSAFMLTRYPTLDELDVETHCVRIDNTGRGLIRAAELVLTVKHRDGSREIVQGVAAAKVRPIFGRHRGRLVKVVLVDDSGAAEDDEFSWVLRRRGFLFWGQPAAAFKLSEVPRLRQQILSMRANGSSSTNDE